MGHEIPENVLKQIEQLQRVRDAASDAKKRLIGLYPCWDAIRDARVTVFSKLINVLNSTQFAYTLAGKHLLDKGWWAQIAKRLPPDSDINIYIREFDAFTKIAFVNLAFSAIESSMRLILRAIDPKACSNGTAEFKGVYDCLLKSKLVSTPPNSVELLDLWRIIRNTVHNNGVYFHRSGTDENVTYKRATYTFRIGQPVEIAVWSFLLDLTQDLVFLVEAVVSDLAVVGVDREITDPFIAASPSAAKPGVAVDGVSPRS